MQPKYLQLIDTQTNGQRYDITPLFADHESFSALVGDIATAFLQDGFDFVVGIDALGFVLGTAVAMRVKKGFIPVRKGGKLPVDTHSISFVDYTGTKKSLELRIGAFPAGARILLVDEWIETGAQVNAAIELIEAQQGIIAGVATINMDDNESTQSLRKRFKCHQAWSN